MPRIFLKKYKYSLFPLSLYSKIKFYQENLQMIFHIIKPPRKTEPRTIVCFRYFVIFISLTFLICSFTMLCTKMIREEPNLSTFLVTTDNLFAPGKKWSFELKN